MQMLPLLREAECPHATDPALPRLAWDLSGSIYVEGDGSPASRDVTVQEQTLACP